jgi:NADH:ubiquinone oxidoreductase subunit 5 (subunit L)/multisubunit Na+/H+ antiporter MnhA subunit
VLAAICTSFYTIRLLTLTFGGWYNGYKSTIEKVHDVKIERTGIVLIALALGSIFIGWGGESIFIEHDVNLVVPRLYSKGPIILILISGISAFIIYNRRGIETQRWGIVGKKVIKFLSKKWYVDRIIHENITMWVLKAGYEYTYKIIDRGILERIGPYGSIKVAQRIRPERVQSGSILGMVRGIIIVLNIMIIIMVIILYKYYYQIF